MPSAFRSNIFTNFLNCVFIFFQINDVTSRILFCLLRRYRRYIESTLVSRVFPFFYNAAHTIHHTSFNWSFKIERTINFFLSHMSKVTWLNIFFWNGFWWKCQCKLWKVGLRVVPLKKTISINSNSMLWPINYSICRYWWNLHTTIRQPAVSQWRDCIFCERVWGNTLHNIVGMNRWFNFDLICWELGSYHVNKNEIILFNRRSVKTEKSKDCSQHCRVRLKIEIRVLKNFA